MASAAEQLASNINFGAFSKATELKKRLWFTLGALIVYRLEPNRVRYMQEWALEYYDVPIPA